MSSYTIELRHVIQNGYDLGLDKYPIFDENYRNILNNKIIEHYYFRELSIIPVEKFKFFINRKMNEIMPYYNQLYKSELIEIQALTRVDYQSEYEKQKTTSSTRDAIENTSIQGEDTTVSETEGNSSSVSSGSGKNLESDTPNTELNLENIESGFYASKVGVGSTEDTSTSESSNVSDIKSNSSSARDNTLKDEMSLTDAENYIKKITGNRANRTDSEMLMEYRQTFLNIDMEIINELEILFHQLW